MSETFHLFSLMQRDLSNTPRLLYNIHLNLAVTELSPQIFTPDTDYINNYNEDYYKPFPSEEKVMKEFGWVESVPVFSDSSVLGPTKTSSFDT